MSMYFPKRKFKLFNSLFLSVCFVFQYVCFLSSIASKVSVENVCYEIRCFDVTQGTQCPVGGGGSLGYFLGGYVPPRTPNWHPVLKQISPKIDTPFYKWANFLYPVLEFALKLIPLSRNGPIFYTGAPNGSVPHNICSTEKILLAGNWGFGWFCWEVKS